MLLVHMAVPSVVVLQTCRKQSSVDPVARAWVM